MQKNISVIISANNSVEWLKRVIWGYNTQTYRNFEIILVQSKNFDNVFAVIETIKSEVFFPILFQRNQEIATTKIQALYKAVETCESDYILMTEGNCIPRPDFIEQHIKFREEGYFLSGGYYQLNNELSEQIKKESIYSGKCFEISWLKKYGMKTAFNNNELNSYGTKSSILNFLNFKKTSWNGVNSSAWKKDILAAYSFEEEIANKSFNSELCKNLISNGLKSKKIFYRTVCLKLFYK